MLFITGIHDPRQLANLRVDTWLGRRRRIAIDLIDDIDRLGAPAAREALFERIVDARGAYKRTYRDRFAAFDAQVLEALRAGPVPRGAFRVLDAGVSDGTTSLPLITLLDDLAGPDLQFTATDLDGRYVKVWRTAAPQRRIILSDRGEIVQVVMPPFLFTHRESRLLFPLNRMLRPRAMRFAEALAADWRQGAADVRSAEILLLNPELKQLIATDPRIAFRPWDILEPWAGGQAHAVRAMNVLNPGYFDAAQMRAVVRHLFDAVVDGGLLAMGSNQDAGSEVDGIIGRRRGHVLETVLVTGRGFRAPDALAGLAIAT